MQNLNVLGTLDPKMLTNDKKRRSLRGSEFNQTETLKKNQEAHVCQRRPTP